VVDGTARKSLNRAFALYWLPVIVWAALIFSLSSMSEPPRPEPVTRLPAWSTWAHWAEFFVLGALLYRAFQGPGGSSPGAMTGRTEGIARADTIEIGLAPGSQAARQPSDDARPPKNVPRQPTPEPMVPATACFLSVLSGAVYAATDEFHQYFVPQRQADPFDWLVDVSGIIVGVAAMLVWNHWCNKT